MEFKNLQWEPAKELLSKAIGTEAKTIAEPLNITYALEYPKYLEDQYPKALCDELEIGQPRAGRCSPAVSPSPSTTRAG